MHNCKDISEMVSKSQDENLSLAKRLSIKIHLILCKKCRNFKDNADTVRKAMQEFNSQDKP
ncbi:MAG: hypothetical protein ACI93R_002037 [Flavobacteriales bacterium]|jgi:hypothetical protein